LIKAKIKKKKLNLGFFGVAFLGNSPRGTGTGFLNTRKGYWLLQQAKQTPK